MIRALPAAALLFVLFAVACNSGDDNDPTPTVAAGNATSPTAEAAACAPSRTRAAGEAREAITSGSDERQYIINVPADYDGASATPLVLVFHPFGGTAEGVAALTAFASAAEALNWITVYPEGTGTPQQWNAEGYTAATDDVAFVRDLVAELQASLCIDARRVYATGYSNGGAMALRAACDLPDTFAAVAPVAAPFPQCQAPVPIVAFHGSLDAAVPYEGGLDGTIQRAPVHRLTSQWARAIGCDGLPVISRAAPNVEIATYARCPRGDNEALLYTVLDGGHTWPGAAIDYPVEEAGVTTHAISATDLIVEFFDAHARP